MGSPRPFTTLPIILSLRLIYLGVVLAVTVSPGEMPSICSKGKRIRWSLWKPTTSASTRRPSRRWIPQSSAKPTMGPFDSTVRPETRTTEPRQSSRCTFRSAECNFSKSIVLFVAWLVVIYYSAVLSALQICSRCSSIKDLMIPFGVSSKHSARPIFGSEMNLIPARSPLGWSCCNFWHKA